ncbi:MAG: CaiB/BaiF CoA transferase family protein [Desulfosudaceae bacterium]
MKKELPLTGIRVLDLSHSWAAPHCGRILADFGAEVIKIEYIKRLCLLRGARKDPQIYNHHPGWLQVNRNKYAMTLDLQAAEDRGVFTDLVKIADVVITNFRPGVMKKLGFGYDDITRIKEDVIVLSMSSFGDTGPYARYCGYGAVFEALGGINSLTAYDQDSRPCRIKEIDVTNGAAGAGAVMTALIHRRKTGQGQYIDLSQLEAATHATIGEHLLGLAMNADPTLPRGNRHWKYAPQGCYRCRGTDKWVVITVRTEAEWKRFCEVVGHPEWQEDKRFASVSARMAHHDQLDQLINQWTGARENIKIMELLQENNIAAGAVLEMKDLAANRHLDDRGYFAVAEQSPYTRFPGMPFALSRGAGKVAWHGPELGRHNEHVLCHLLGRSSEEVRPVKASEVGTAFDKSPSISCRQDCLGTDE